MEEITRQLETARDQYDKLSFNTNALFNEPAPKPVVAFAIGGVLSLIGISMWLSRTQALKRKMAARNPPIVLSGNALIRAYISCAIDADSPFYVIVSFGAVSFLFLGGVQLDYKITLLAMIVTYTVSAFAETARVLLAFKSARSLSDVVVTSNYLASKLRGVSTELSPSNVYEDLGRGKTIVLMVFITQVILISFVCVDIFDNGQNSCRDGTSGCPIAGTLGSWGFYVLGIFMACVFQLGPKTKFGESEQNPAYWLQLLLATKQSGAKVTWYDPVKDKTSERFLYGGDWRTWMRFWMSFLINGVGYHILVHALPIQVAAQSSLTGVVFRAVGMMYLVDLDDTPGYKLTIVQKPDEEIKKAEQTKKEEAVKEEAASAATEEVSPTTGTAPAGGALGETELSQEAELILEDARKKLEALARGELPAGRKRGVTNQDLLVGVLLTDNEGPDKDKTSGVAMGASGEDEGADEEQEAVADAEC